MFHRPVLNDFYSLEDKAKATLTKIRSFPSGASIKALQSFLGEISRFYRHYAKLLTPEQWNKSLFLTAEVYGELCHQCILSNHPNAAITSFKQLEKICANINARLQFETDEIKGVYFEGLHHLILFGSEIQINPILLEAKQDLLNAEPYYKVV